MTSARNHLIEIHKNLLETLKEEVHTSVEATPALLSYENDYEMMFKDALITPTDRRELVKRIAESQMVYIGDYHTLRQSQRTVVRLLKDISKRGTPVVMCVEMFRAEHQEHVSSYVRGRMDEEAFLEAIRYGKTWGFPWENYRSFLKVCIKEGIPVVGLNHDFGASRGTIEKRDRFAAEIIAAQTLNNPDAIVFVLYGDHHLAQNHIPQQVQTILNERLERRKTLYLYQNPEPIYWKLVDRGIEREVDVVRLSDDVFCIMNCPPWIQLRSYLNWKDNNEELLLAGDSAWDLDGGGAANYHDQFVALVRAICEFLDLPVAALDDFAIYTSEDLDFLQILEKNPRIPTNEYERIKTRIQNDGSSYIPAANIVYLEDLGINSVAEKAGEFIYVQRSGIFKRRPAPPDANSERDHFYRNLFVQALGYFSSKVINFRRKTDMRADFESYLSEQKRRRLDPGMKDKREIARHVIDHLDFERRSMASKNKPAPLRKIYGIDEEMNRAVSRALGNILGSRLYDAVMEGLLSREYLRDLFSNPFKGPGSAFDEYMRLKSIFLKLKELERSKDDFL